MDDDDDSTLVPQLDTNMNIGDWKKQDDLKLFGTYRQRAYNSLEINADEGKLAALSRLAVKYLPEFLELIGQGGIKVTAKNAVNFLVIFFMRFYSEESQVDYDRIKKITDDVLTEAYYAYNNAQRSRSSLRTIKVPTTRLDYTTIMNIVPELERAVNKDEFEKRMQRFNEVQVELKKFSKDKQAFIRQLEGTLDAISKLGGDEKKDEMHGYIKSQLRQHQSELDGMEKWVNGYILRGGRNPFSEEEPEQPEPEHEEEKLPPVVETVRCDLCGHVQRAEDGDCKFCGGEKEVAEVKTKEAAVKLIPEAPEEKMKTTIKVKKQKGKVVVEKPKKDALTSVEKAIQKEQAELDAVEDEDGKKLSPLESDIRAVRKMNRDEVRKKARELGLKDIRKKVKKVLVAEVVEFLKEQAE